MHFTQNPIGSDDQLDLQDNAISFDYAMNSPAALWQDRFGKQHKTVQQALKDVGFKPAGFDFVSGGTLGIGDRDKCVFYPTDGYWYSWNGKLPYVVTANSSPTPGGKKGWGVVTRDERVIAREALRRTYQEVGLNLVEGSFEEGAVLVNVNDVLLHEASGKAFSGPSGAVSSGTDPTAVAGYVPRTDVTLRGDLGVIRKTFDSVSSMISDSSLSAGDMVTWLGYYSALDGGGNSGVVKSGAHVADNGNIFSLSASLYVEANFSDNKIDVRKFGVTDGASVTGNSAKLNSLFSFTATMPGVKTIDFNGMTVAVDIPVVVSDIPNLCIINGTAYRPASMSDVAYALRFLRCDAIEFKLNVKGTVSGASAITAGHLGIKFEGCKGVTVPGGKHEYFGDSSLTIESEDTTTESYDIKVSGITFEHVCQTSTTHDGVSSCNWDNITVRHMFGALKFASRLPNANLNVTNVNADNVTEVVRATGYDNVNIADINGGTVTSTVVYVETNSLAPSARDMSCINVRGVNCKSAGSGVLVNNNPVSAVYGALGKLNISDINIDTLTGSASNQGVVFVTGGKVKSLNIDNINASNIASYGINIQSTADSSDEANIRLSRINLDSGATTRAPISFISTATPYKNVTLSDIVCKGLPGSSINKITEFTIRNFKEYSKKSQTVVYGSNGVVDDSKFSAATGFTGVRYNVQNVDLVRCKASSDSTFAVLFEAGCTGLREFFPSTTGTRTALAVPTGEYQNAGTPEGVIVAGIGSTCRDTVNGKLYVKTTATLATGWIAQA